MPRAWIEAGLNVVFLLLSGWLIVSTYSIDVHEIELVDGQEFVHIERSKTMIMSLLYVITLAILLFYGNYFNILSLSKKQGRVRVILLSIGLFAVSYLLHWSIEMITVPHVAAPLPLGLTTGLLLFYFSVSTAYGVGKLWVLGERQRQQLSLEKKQSELNLLRNQLQPHFLFNVLNSLLSMIDQQKHPELSKSIDSLSALLRYVVDETTAGPVPVSREITFLENYAELQMLRFGDGEVNFSLEVQGEYQNQLIEPGLFLPFVENAFRYGLEPESESGIAVKVNISDPNAIVFSVVNKVYPQLQNTRAGTGLSSVKRRLELVYPGRYELDIHQNHEFYVELRIMKNESDNH